MTPAATLQIRALHGIPEISSGDDLVDLITTAADGTLRDGDILVVTSKIVSKAEGRFAPESERAAAIERESVRVVAEDATGSVRIVESRLGIVAAAAGVDASNVPEGMILLLPEDPDASARALAAGLRERTGARVGVIVSDTLGRAWRDGQTDCAIGAAGVHVFEELGGQQDAAGKVLRVTRPCVADELAAASDLVKRKASGCPVAVVTGRAD
ncbi:coenzyme F420-0:L-glutamate ligase, partial [Microbacterium sp.]|uniref:coenzyme F420-0:L-glutamate ligase n=1 Tax=Microbacterium sp. TaxID=51671 RepID=UPI003C741D38